MHQPDAQRQLAILDARLLVVSFATLDRLTAWVPYFRDTLLAPSYGSPYRGRHAALPADIFARTGFVADPARTAYSAYGLGRNSALRVYGPGIIWQYIKWGMQGRPIKIHDDTLQRGGDFVIGRAGRLTLAHTGRDQSDRPAVGAILAALRQT